jgi:hypothetical protein
MTRRALPVLLVLLCLAACSARTLRDAQDAFSDAAAIENRAFGIDNPGALLDQSAAAAGYRVALDLVTTEIERNETSLRADDLLGSALVLKAMCEWRLAALAGTDPKALDATLLRIRDDADLTLGERDAAMVAALPGLRDLDRGRGASTYADADRFFGSAFQTIDRAVDVAPPRHPVVIYLRLAQLAALREWHTALYTFPMQVEVRDTRRRDVKTKAVSVMTALNRGWARDDSLRDAVKRSADAMGISRETEPGFAWDPDLQAAIIPE